MEVGQNRGWRIESILVFLFLIIPPAAAGEVEELKKDLALVQLRISEEEARYQAAKAAMERSQLVAQYLFPELRLREQQLTQKLQKLEESKDESKTAAKSAK